MKKTSLFILLLISTLFSCDEPDCILQGGSKMKIGFYSVIDGTAQPLRINLLEVEGIDGSILENSNDTSDVVLPINPADSEIRLYFDTEFGLDTLIVGYKKTARLISEDCGTEVVYNGIEVIRSDFDSVRVFNASMETNFLQPELVNENIRVYN
ncbi:DUF6452 family protein [Fulvivirga lutea]|uniref:Uncharacterized protein n=1 Tax=Fulvivirga lutea TaxID=2810512 RepID=A0A974WH00_9BACT|nr:DUF6452 family protein [Fulvivirga lutea]QSE97905.1 hypothetical protein JR347_02120 [Fulvivirga lutea]